MRKVNKAGLDLIKSFETCVLHPYDDGAGFQTVGWGHLIRRGEHFDTITQDEADELLRHDLAQAESAVERLVKVPLNDNQFGALVSFTFNVGAGGLGRSSLLRSLNNGRYQDVPDRLKVWNKANGKVMKGLTRRREAEGALFMRPGPTTHDIAADVPRTAVPASPVAEGTPAGDAPAGTQPTQPGADPATTATTQAVQGGGAKDMAENVTGGTRGWARDVSAWIATLFATASGHVERAFNLDPSVQKWLLVGVAALGVVYLATKAIGQWQVRKIHADPSLQNVK